ncbi:hypothetical protein HYC85_028372 [Camellia sinensis]|uniref:Uncharacterized protein n=1 Tax=Camellia sinensis TaxID=4442 RepID=A0A7J7FW66_CAMSI|nr:hypothetical protein HYC85_028372 [Camellia sinensis]
MVALALSSFLHASNSSIYGSIKLNPCCPTPSLLTTTKISQNTTRKNSYRSRRLTIFTTRLGRASFLGSRRSFSECFAVELLDPLLRLLACLCYHCSCRLFCIASVFEYLNQKPVFGILSSDSVFYAPLLEFFAVVARIRVWMCIKLRCVFSCSHFGHFR